MLLTETRCSYEAEVLFSKFKVLACLAADGDVDRHGSSEAHGWAHSDADLGTADRVLWLSCHQALQRMSDDPDTVELLRARLDAAVHWSRGEFTNWRRFCSTAVIASHDNECMERRYGEGRERLFQQVNGVFGVATTCNCSEVYAAQGFRLLKGLTK